MQHVRSLLLPLKQKHGLKPKLSPNWQQHQNAGTKPERLREHTHHSPHINGLKSTNDKLPLCPKGSLATHAMQNTDGLFL